MIYIILFFYLCPLLFIFMFSLSQLHLAWHFTQAKKAKRKEDIFTPKTTNTLPRVTVQLPVYNELYVIERLLDTIVALEYPKEELEIQVLDDSTDETSTIISKKVDLYAKKGVLISHLQRKDRRGYKAGALQEGLKKATGEYIAIFDADFVPSADFLLKTLPAFENQSIGMVQTRWDHLNKNYSMLTRLQAFGLNAHFSVEQIGRQNAGSFINFNGTAGVWRKTCIEDAGGWSADTLTEDLDLSYRAQLRGWKFKYLEEVNAPAELPVIMPAIKSQQYRWNKGAAETAKKHFSKIAKSRLSLSVKIHAFFHLFNSSIFICIFLAAVLSVPMLYVKHTHHALDPFFNLGLLFIAGFLSIAIFYWIANKNTYATKNYFLYYLKTFPLFLIVSMGLSFHNGLAVVEGLMGKKTPFIRTPKFNIKNSSFGLKGNKYMVNGFKITTIIEGLLCLYFVFGIISAFYLQDFTMVFFHLMLTLGFAMVFYYTIKPHA